jgi:large subunit ribosomal protein L16
MPLIPKRVKFRKKQRGRSRGIAQSGNKVSFGEYGLQSLGRGWVTNIQIEACRIAVNRNMKRKGKVWIRVFPDKPITKKPLETRMGKGKANVDGWVAVVKPGTMLFEVSGVSEGIAKESLRLAATKLPVRVRIVQRQS